MICTSFVLRQLTFVDSAIADIGPGNTSKDLKEYKDEFAKLQRDWQHKMFSPVPGNFWAQYISHVVTTYNTATHIPNLMVEAKLNSSNVTSQDSAAQQQLHLDLLTAATEHRDVWERSVTDQLDKARAEHTKLSLKTPGSVRCRRLMVHIQRLVDDIKNTKAPQFVDATHAHADSQADILPKKPYYEDLDVNQAYEFWNQRLDLKTANNVWSFAGKSVPIEANLEAPNIGKIMSHTFCVMAHQTWQHVLGPRLENQAIMRELGKPDVGTDVCTIVAIAGHEPWEEDSPHVFNMLRDINQTFFSKLPGIECVLVPSGGLNNPTKGKRVKCGSEDEDIREMAPTMKKQKSANIF